MSEYDPDAEARAYEKPYGEEDDKAYSAPYEVTPPPLPPVAVVAPAPASSPQARALAGGLGDFTPEGRCVLTTLSKLLWRFFSQVADGQTMAALTTLAVYQSLYNLKRNVIAPGFSPAVVAGLPLRLPDVSWSQPMIDSAKLVLAGAFGPNAAVIAVLRAMPQNMGAVGAWFPTLRNAAPPEDLATLRAYQDAPTPVGSDPARILSAYVADDLVECQGPRVAPAPPPPPPPPRVNTGSGSTASGAPPPTQRVREGGLGFFGFALLALAGYGAWLAYQDAKKLKSGVSGMDEDFDKHIRRARAALQYEEPKSVAKRLEDDGLSREDAYLIVRAAQKAD